MKEQSLEREKIIKDFLRYKALFSGSAGTVVGLGDKVVLHYETIQAIKDGFVTAAVIFGLGVAIKGILVPAIRKTTERLSNRNSAHS